VFGARFLVGFRTRRYTNQLHIALTDTLSFSFALTATLCFKRRFPTGRVRTDLKRITSAVVPFYASIRCRFMLQGTAQKLSAVSTLPTQS
jgi:hypothetical protein